jgi:HlyD family secretion protein
MNTAPTASRTSLRLGSGLVAVLFVMNLSACEADQPDAYGNFEADEVAVSSELAGLLDRFELQEGSTIEPGTVVAQVDTLQLSLQRQELVQQRLAARLRAEETRAEVGVLQAQLRTARDDYERTQRLFEDTAATASDLNRMQGRVDTLEQQITAARARVRMAEQEAITVDARVLQLDDQIRRGTVRNPLRGTVLTTYVEPGEYVQPGRTLYTIAALDTLTLRAYVSGDQLASIRIGQDVQVRYDTASDHLADSPGRITWVSSVAEFTPTPIQTREERVDQVYAVKIRVPNPEGRLKIGMPGELVFVPAPGGETGR